MQRYVPDVVRALYGVITNMAKQDPGAVHIGPHALLPPSSSTLASKWAACTEKDHQLIRDVASGAVTAHHMTDKLQRHVDMIDSQLALEFVARQGGQSKDTRQHLWLPPAEGDLGQEDGRVGGAPTLHHAGFSLQLLPAVYGGPKKTLSFFDCPRPAPPAPLAPAAPASAAPVSL